MSPLLFFTLTGAFWAAYAARRSRKSMTDDQRLLDLIVDAKTTTIADAPTEGRIQITGRATSADGGDPITAPFTGEECLWARAEMRTSAGNVDGGWTVAVEAIEIEDGSGALARLELENATLRFQPRSVPSDESARFLSAFLDKQGYRAKGGARNATFPLQALLRPGATISVLATARRPEGDYRGGERYALALSARDGEVIVFDPDVAEKAPANDRDNFGCAVVALIAFLIVSLIVFLEG